ncbi:MAG TPA: adenosylcobinamide-GDP ribazoletransferase [Acetobacteraceae bacterium]|nr:adenosylcobinamide-GDP ribazoletransferase [Acetobacteraceae bacterium]
MSRLNAELASAFGLLTQIPLGRFLPEPEAVDHGRSVWSYPLVGLALGALAGLIYRLAIGFGMMPLLAACWTLVASILLTGGLHEDGLADTTDGLGGGRNPARKLEIMQDSRIGSFGTLSLLLSLALRGSALVSIARPSQVAVALIVAGVLGRTVMIVPLRFSCPARPSGMAAALGAVRPGPASAGIVIGIVVAGLLIPLRLAVLLIAVTLALGLAWSRWLTQQVGGYTGDTLGALELIAECLILTIMAIEYSPAR